MIKDVLEYKWNKFVEDSDSKPKSNIRIFVASFVILVNKQVVDAQVVANRIRSIPNVTTVSREDIGTSQTTLHKGFFRIKFVLETYEDLNTYITQVLKKG